MLRAQFLPARFRPLSLALVVAAVPVPASAAEEPVQEIVVTARRIDERMADVPLAVDLIPGNVVATGGIDGLQSLAAHVPGLSFEAAWGGWNSFPVLRGQNQPSVAGDNVGMFVDGVYQANRDAIDVEPLDLDRIEVVRGPQSALFGHSTFAGLISYVPAGPTETLQVKGAADAGTHNLRGVSGAISGPINDEFKGRLAASWRQADGTWENAAAPGQHLGNARDLAIAGTIATRDGSGSLSMRLSGRHGESRANQPAFFTLDYRSYNCGARDATSGAWSYFCGAAPIPAQVAVSPDLPDSRTHSDQLALHLALDLEAIELLSESSIYGAASSIYRDLDGSPQGDLYGVCVQSVNCSGFGRLAIPVVRLQRVNVVFHRTSSARELTQELRIRSTGERRFAWQVGATVFWSRQASTLAFGAQRGALAGSELLSSPVLSDLQRVGPPAALNVALVDNPAARQILFNDSTEARRTIALFATADYRLTQALRLRAELRATWERLTLDSRTANFLPSFGTSLGAQHFHDITPRFSLDWRLNADLLVFASYAKGTRSGGINAIPNLRADEQTYAPESNWTAEIGAKYVGGGLVRSAQLTAYDIDWRDTQIRAVSATPGFPSLIFSNTSGIRTRGVEAAAQIVPAGWLALDLAWSYTDPRFKAGSEDPGFAGSCGLSVVNSVSSFCTIRPSTISPGQLVPDISGNLVSRVARTSWSAALTLAPPLAHFRSMRLHVDVTHQGNEYDQNIDGLYFGARTLLGARLSIPLGHFVAELWGTNLTDARYVRDAATRQPGFYATVPRPTDLILADRRRVGLTLRFPG